MQRRNKMANSNQTEINLDKICAEYGMGLLNNFRSIEIDLQDKMPLNKLIDFNGLMDKIDNFRYNKTQNFDRDKISEYRQELEKIVYDKIKSISSNDKLSYIAKVLLITWYIYPFKDALCGKQFPKQIQRVDEEKRRIENLNKKLNFQFEFSPSAFETEINKALGILVEDGPFAYIIWLKSQDKEPHRAMLIQTAIILQKLGIINTISSDENLKDKIEKAFLDEISTDLTKTLLVKTVLEKMLIYARYKAKAMQHE